MKSKGRESRILVLTTGCTVMPKANTDNSGREILQEENEILHGR